MPYDNQDIGHVLERIEVKIDLILQKLDKSKSEDNVKSSAKLTDDKEIEALEKKLDDADAY